MQKKQTLSKGFALIGKRYHPKFNAMTFALLAKIAAAIDW